MAKLHARNVSIYVDDASGASTSITGDLNTITLDISAEAPEVTSFGDNTVQRLSNGIRDFSVSMDGFYNQGVQAACVLEGLLAGSSYMQLGVAGSATGCPKKCACIVCTAMNISWGVNDAISFSAEFSGRSGSITASAW